jgi:hypothetical protein
MLYFPFSCNLIFILNFNQTSLMKICVSQIYEKPHSSKIVFTLFNQEKIAFCVLHKWYIKRYTTEQIFDCYMFDPVWHHPLFYIYIEGLASQFTINHTIWRGQLKHLLTKAMYEILKRGKFLNLSISRQLDLFDKVVKPILLYGCELWGLSNCDIIERVHLKYCKLLLILKSSTPNCMIYGELGR